MSFTQTLFINGIPIGTIAPKPRLGSDGCDLFQVPTTLAFSGGRLPHD
jgi:hypothetical protein